MYCNTNSWVSVSQLRVPYSVAPLVRVLSTCTLQVLVLYKPVLYSSTEYSIYQSTCTVRTDTVQVYTVRVLYSYPILSTVYSRTVSLTCNLWCTSTVDYWYSSTRIPYSYNSTSRLRTHISIQYERADEEYCNIFIYSRLLVD